ncbi:MAG: class I SAM-dependent methyltransferase [Gaiellaceae bacterium]
MRSRRSPVSAAEEVPFGVSELVASVADAATVLDAGCGSGRLTVILAEAGAAVTGVDTSPERLDQARERAVDRRVDLQLVQADFNESLPFAEHSFEAAVSRLSLMAARDAVSTLRELRRVLVVGGCLTTALWARPEQNPWFAHPRSAAAAVLGADRATFARAFGKLGEPDEAAQTHRAAGLRDVHAELVAGRVEVAGAQEHWTQMTDRIGHFSRLDSGLSGSERSRIIDELAERLEPFRSGDLLALPRTLVLVTARREPV